MTEYWGLAFLIAKDGLNILIWFVQIVLEGELSSQRFLIVVVLIVKLVDKVSYIMGALAGAIISKCNHFIHRSMV